ncbi:GGDEF domain-containing response regulator [Anaeromyxobacter oryzisoli]|uniref:GGDEF domain-containing response regulator n=1 Tax=Anaeromyxobacter oryzisoli TaxID=2925408 RepID=UPI001F569EFD|nr:response regulator [Anaeromyxobacter sp. SG63]
MATGRILVVDDEKFFQDLFRDALAEAGHATRIAASAEEALDRLGEERFDLLVTDVVMPGQDGIALVREARRRDPDLEAVAITGHEDVRLAVQAMKAGCADFLTKPIEREELLRVADRALSRASLRREHSQLLTENLEFAKAQALYRQGLQILASLDGERIVDLALSILARVTDAQGAALWVADEKGQLQLRGYRGLVDRASLPVRIDPRDPAWAEPLQAGAPFQASFAEPGEAFLVPLVADDEPVGLALVSDRARGRFGDDEHAAALTVADFTAIAVKNARRFQALERVGLRDRETGAYNLAYFVDYAGKEFYKARRYGRAFSLVVLSVDNAEQLRKEAGRDEYRRVIRDLVSATSRVARDADILAKVSESEYYVLLPETDYFGALMFLRRATEEVRKEESVRRVEERLPVLLSMGAATFPKDGEDFDELLHWARGRVQEQRGSLLRRLHLDDLGRNAFWELADLLLSDRAPIPETSPSARLDDDGELFAAAQREAAREIARDPRARGLLYVGVKDGLAGAPLRDALPPGDPAARAGDGSVRVYLLGPRGGGEDAPPHPLVTEVYLDGDQRLAGHELLLFMSEHSAYGLLSAGGRTFHTSDVPLVDALVSKLQALYDLQPL